MISKLAKGKIQERDPIEVKTTLKTGSVQSLQRGVNTPKHVSLGKHSLKTHSYTSGLGFPQEFSAVSSVPPRDNQPSASESAAQPPFPFHRCHQSRRCFWKKSPICFEAAAANWKTQGEKQHMQINSSGFLSVSSER